MDNEMEQFQRDMLTSVREMKAGKAARVTEVKQSASVAEARVKVDVTGTKKMLIMGKLGVLRIEELTHWDIF